MKNNRSCLKGCIIYTRVNRNIRSRELKGTAKHWFAGGNSHGHEDKIPGLNFKYNISFTFSSHVLIMYPEAKFGQINI